MQIVQRIIPERVVSTYNGTSKDGNAYQVMTWLVKTVNDGKLIAVAAFEKDHEILDANKGLLIDCVLDIYCREWNGKYYNDLKLSNAKNPDKAIGEEDVPQSSVQQDTGGKGLVDVPEEENGLPF